MKEVGFSSVIVYNDFHMADNREAKRKTGKGSAIEGHEERFLKAFDEYADALFRHAVYRLSDRERAIEIVHDTFTKVWTYIRNGHEIDSDKPFLYKVAPIILPSVNEMEAGPSHGSIKQAWYS